MEEEWKTITITITRNIQVQSGSLLLLKMHNIVQSHISGHRFSPKTKFNHPGGAD